MAILRVLGCSGGFAAGRHTSSFLLDHRVLFDAGTGVGSLTTEELAQVDHVFLTHAHLDHVLALPLLLDVVHAGRRSPIRVYALAQTLQALKDHFFNGAIWPSLDELQGDGSAPLVFEAIGIGQSVAAGGGIEIMCLPARHAVPACGYWIRGHQKSIVYTGDTCCSPEFWAAVNAIPDLQSLIIEVSFFNAEQSIADQSFHLTPQALARELGDLASQPEILITHLKPGRESALMQEVLSLLGEWNIRALQIGDELSV